MNIKYSKRLENKIFKFIGHINILWNSISSVLYILIDFFKVMQQLESTQVDWYAKLVAPLSEQDKKSLQEVFMLANQRKNARESRNIEQAGGNYFY